MALLSRIKNLAKPNYNLVNIFKRHYFQINNHHFQSSFSPNHQILCYGRDGFFSSSVRYFAAPPQFHKKKFEAKKLTRPRLNDEIDVDIVRLVSDEGHSVVSRRVALQRAAELECDLVEVDSDAKPPVCKIMDYKREMYKKQVKGKEKAKLKSGDSLKAASVKEVRFSAKAELKDIKIKANNVRRLLERGYRVKCSALAGEGLDLSSLLTQISALIEDIAFVELGPKLEERQGYFIVRHIKFGPSKKGNKGSKGLTSIRTNAEIQKESSTSSDGLVDCGEEIDAEESDMDSDNDGSDVHLDKVKPTLQGEGGRSSSVNQVISNFVPSVRPTLQPENRYAKKVPSIDKSGVRLDEVKPPFQGQGGRSSSINNNAGPNFVPNVGPNFVPSVTPTLQPKNRYAKKVPSNAPPARYPNSGTQPQSHSTGFPPVGPRQAGGEASSSRKSRPRQNENLQPRGDIPNRAQSGNNFSPHVGLPRPPSFNGNDGSKSTSFGLFSGAKANDGYINPPSSGSDGGAASNDKKWGIFSGKN